METIESAVAAKKAKLDALRPLVGRSLAVLDRWIDVELTYTSNAIEGSTLTRSETAIVVEKGLTVSGKPLKDHLEAVDHMAALALVRSLAAGADPIRERDIRDIHRMVLARSDPEEAGRYARHQRAVLGAEFRFPSPVEIPALMGEFGNWLAQGECSPDLAFESHCRLVTIHPFADGNGRTARLLMNLILVRIGHPPVAIGPEQRVAYLDALQAGQLRNEGGAWRELMWRQLDASLTTYLDRLADHRDPEA